MWVQLVELSEKLKNAKCGHFLSIPKWRPKLTKNALKCVTLSSAAPFIASNRNVQDAGRGAALASVTHFNAFLTNFGRHFETLRKMAALSVF